jgi:ecotin
MVKQKLIVVALGALSVAAVPAIAQDHDAQNHGTHTQAATPQAPVSTAKEVLNMRPYPAAEKGQKRHVIQLPELADESVAKVELIVGRTMNVDCNHHRFGGQIEERTAEGWGYNYYVLKDLGQGMATQMGCGNTATRSVFVTSPDQPLIRYNSKLPVVIYAPADVEVRYRIWRADAAQTLG